MASGCSRFTLRYCSRTGAGFSAVALVDGLAFQLPGRGLLDVNQSHGARFGAERSGPKHDPVLAAAAAELAIRSALHQHLDRPTQPATIRVFRNPSLRVQQHVDAALLFCRQHVVRLPGGRSTRPRGKTLNVHDIELDLLEQLERALELLL